MHPSLRDLSNSELLQRLRQVALDERRAIAVLVAHLAEMDRRGLYRDEGYSSLFAYCVQVLRLSESAAYARIQAARVSRRFPDVLRGLASGQLHLSAVKLLGPRLTADNYRALLAAASGKTKAQVEALLAERFPQPLAPTVIRKLPTPAQTKAELPLLDQTSTHGERPSARAAQSPASSAGTESGVAMPKQVERGRVTPLAPERFKVQFTASRSLRDKLETAQRLCGHSIGGGDVAGVVELALDVLIDKRLKERIARTDKPRRVAPAPPKPGSRTIPAHVRREVAERDGMQCTFVSERGHRCQARERLEFHHDELHCHGGPPTAANIRLLCQSHNQLQAERDLGPLFMQRKRTRSGTSAQV